MRKYLLAAVAALAFGGSAFAQPLWSDEARIVGALGEGSRRCDATYEPRAMAFIAGRLLGELQRKDGVSGEQARGWIDAGAQSFDNDEARYGTTYACGRAGVMLLNAYKTWAKYNLPGGQQ
jgi:hypothetical protein